MEARMNRRLKIARAALPAAALLALAGCAAQGGGPGAGPALAQAPNPSEADHNTAATGMGLGPQEFNSNGGAFGPDQLSK
jgi:hypothetical protein